MKIEKIDFPYNTNAVSEKQFKEHIKLYEGYVNKTNEIHETLNSKPERSRANAVYSEYRGLKKGETYALDGVILHEQYFHNMTSKKSAVCENTLALFNKYFKSYDNWLEDFKACAKSARGWCITAYDQRTHCLKNILLDAHDDGVICMAFPLLVLDMYEHAYFMDYGTNKESYLHNFIQSIDWHVVESRASVVKVDS